MKSCQLATTGYDFCSPRSVFFVSYFFVLDFLALGPTPSPGTRTFLGRAKARMFRKKRRASRSIRTPPRVVCLSRFCPTSHDLYIPRLFMLFCVSLCVLRFVFLRNRRLCRRSANQAVTPVVFEFFVVSCSPSIVCPRPVSSILLLFSILHRPRSTPQRPEHG